MDQADEGFGVAALGAEGAFTVEVLDGRAGRWLLSVESPAWSFNFELAAPGRVRELSEFLRLHAGWTDFAELAVGSFLGVAVRMIKDDEFPDRFFLRAAGAGSLIEFTLTGEAGRSFIGAVGQAAQELEATA